MARNIQALTAVMEDGRWKHLALAGDEYVVFTDEGIKDGPGSIARKWSFLPNRFQSNIDAAAVVGQDDGWHYTFIKGNERVVFTDKKILDGPSSVTDKWPFLKDFLQGVYA
ncbi:hypothetical protein [Streptomyces sp. CT34]|uniref:hypothetical protein n=1 Tax=Streptomyces sp. CT34 TaxID=1553907 RepID=UPI0005BA3377|nr:hypothetical protein [Streptomyces sp. CT34]